MRVGGTIPFGKLRKFEDDEALTKYLRIHALILAESANLLRVPGRKVAPATPIPSLVDEPPAPEDLPPDQIQILI